MTKDKCNNCGATESKTFWDFKDDTMLCDKCHRLYGKDWQKEIDSKHNGKKRNIFLDVLKGLGILFVIVLIAAFFGLFGPSSNDSNTVDGDNYVTEVKENANYIPPTQTTPRVYCGDGECNNGESCNTCPTDCKQFCTTDDGETLTSTTNDEPYYSVFCDKINPYDLSVREAAAKAIRNDPGSYSITQLFDIYDWVKDNIIYQNVPLAGIPYSAKETLATKSGDCKNQAVLIASMIESIGGTAKVVIDPTCEHAYTMVRFASAGEDLSQEFVDAVSTHYNSNVKVNYITNADGVWVIFDPAGGNYPGNTLDECSGDREVYYIDSCLSCKQQYPNMPYTLGDKCYAECPQGTIHVNNYACSPCPEGYWSYDNECVTCQSGYVLHTDGKCYPE